MKDYDENKESSNLQYWHENNLYDWVISQKLPVNKFERTENLIKISYKNTMKKVMKDISLKLIFNILKKIPKLHNDLLFLTERMWIKKVEKFVANLHDKTKCYTHKKFETSIKTLINFDKGS